MVTNLSELHELKIILKGGSEAVVWMLVISPFSVNYFFLHPDIFVR